MRTFREMDDIHGFRCCFFRMASLTKGRGHFENLNCPCLCGLSKVTFIHITSAEHRPLHPDSCPRPISEAQPVFFFVYSLNCHFCRSTICMGFDVVLPLCRNAVLRRNDLSKYKTQNTKSQSYKLQNTKYKTTKSIYRI